MGKVDEEKWLYYYNELKKYYNENNNSNVPVSYITEDGIRLGKWLTKQRYLYSKNALSDDRIKKLEKLSVSWSYTEDKWNKHYAYLKEYYDKNGNSDVLQHYVTEDGFNLGIWLSEQRLAYKTGILNKRRIKLLKELKVKMNTRDDNWNEFFEALEDYYEQNGNSSVSFDYETKDGIKLGQWLTTQRKSYKLYKLNSERRMLLNDLEVDWVVSDTMFLNKPITNANRYKKVMLERMKHILDDLSYGVYGEISNEKSQARIEKEIIKRMWR